MICDFKLYADDLEVTKVRKLICDCCGKEIDESYKSDGLGLQPKAHLTVYGNDNGLDWVDLEYDLCQFCSEKVVDCIKFNKDVAKSV